MVNPTVLIYNLDDLNQEILVNILKNYQITVSTNLKNTERCKIFICGYRSNADRKDLGILRVRFREAVFLAVVSTINLELLEELLKEGFIDYLQRPFKERDVYFKIRKALIISESKRRLIYLEQFMEERLGEFKKQKDILEERLDKSTHHLSRLYSDLQETYLGVIRTLAQALDSRDHYTHSHSQNVARIAREIALEMGLPLETVKVIEEAGYLHDIGKISVDDSILHKVEKLTPEEWEKIRQHPEDGAKILGPLDFLGEAIEIVRQHHERFDGKGYPRGYKGDQILLGARILMLADSYEAMRSQRPYRRRAYTKQEVVEEIIRNKGKQFDPQVVEAFLRAMERLD